MPNSSNITKSLIPIKKAIEQCAKSSKALENVLDMAAAPDAGVDLQAAASTLLAKLQADAAALKEAATAFDRTVKTLTLGFTESSATSAKAGASDHA
jgi:hypothetical protein